MGDISRGMIEFEGVRRAVSGPSGLRPAIDDIDFSLDRGEAVALMGANGSGKSTLCRCANGLLTPEAGSVRVDGLSTADAGEALEIRRRVGMIFQDPTQQLVTWSVGDEISFGPENLGLAPEAIEEAVGEALARWGLEGLREAHPAGLSGGQAAAAALASVMVMEPAYLVVDEAGSLLDRAGRRRLLAALSEARRGGEVGVLWVTQFPEEAVLCDRLVIMSGGRIVADGDPRLLLSDVSGLREWGLEPAPSVLISWHLRSLGLPLSRLHLEADSLADELGALGLAGSAPRRSPPAPPRRDSLLRMEGATYAYDGGPPVVADVCLEVQRGEGVALAGPSGSGKSTLSLLACGALAPVSGTVERPPVGGTMRPVGLCAQLPEEQFCTSTVAGEITMGLSKQDPKALRRVLEEVTAMVGLDMSEIAGRSPLSLSEGEKKKVALASALSCRGSLLVLDEPTLGLDGPSVEGVLAAVRGHLRAGGGALIASHSGDFLLRATERLFVLGEALPVGQVSWKKAIRRYGEWGNLPGGQLLRLFSRTGSSPDFEALGSLQGVAEWLAASCGGAGAVPGGPAS